MGNENYILVADKLQLGRVLHLRQVNLPLADLELKVDIEVMGDSVVLDAETNTEIRLSDVCSDICCVCMTVYLFSSAAVESDLFDDVSYHLNAEPRFFEGEATLLLNLSKKTDSTVCLGTVGVNKKVFKHIMNALVASKFLKFKDGTVSDVCVECLQN